METGTSSPVLSKAQLCPGNNRKILVNFQMEDKMIKWLLQRSRQEALGQ